MTWPVAFNPDDFNLATDRVASQDGQRQLATVREIVARLGRQPGLVLADEVGMGKTFVALAIAVTAALNDKGGRPVVVMVPSTLRDKWPRDWDVFKKLCLRHGEHQSLKAEPAASGLDFFKLLDDPRRKRARIIFLTHGSFHTCLSDPWVKLAIIRSAMHGVHLGERRQVLPRFVAELLRNKSMAYTSDLYARLLGLECSRWKDAINAVTREEAKLTDDPVPEAVERVLVRGELDLQDLTATLRELPLRSSAYIADRLAQVRAQLNIAIRSIWPQALAQARFRSPLLILDEAHHLKNPATRLASLFVEPENGEDAEMLAGALSNGFERMLFLTATPFQLGHQELLNILDRFNGIAWDSLPSLTREAFGGEIKALGQALDTAQLDTSELDRQWQSIRSTDLPGGSLDQTNDWWAGLATAAGLPERIAAVRRTYQRAFGTMRKAEEFLRPWVIRHLRSRQLEQQIPRRVRLDGRALCTGGTESCDGIPIAEEAVLPFLLAARSQALVAHSQRKDGRSCRATFAEGLASSYEAFLETRAEETPQGSGLDEEEAGQTEADPRLQRYMKHLSDALPSHEARAQHPKMSALVARVASLWEEGEKVVVFCHYQATGRALARHVSAEIDRRMFARVQQQIAASENEARERVRLAGDAFEPDRPAARALNGFLSSILEHYKSLDEPTGRRIHDVVRRFVRTPPFLTRYMDLARTDREDAVRDALDKSDGSGLTLRRKLEEFVRFIAERCQAEEREEYLEALESITPGARGEPPKDSADMDAARALLLPNVRLANGPVRQETRRRLLLGFNSPFFPEILIASSVMAEGVDLHLNCRHLIHYDLSWNPSTVEQRTGRVDRIGAKAERVGKSIQVFWPYVAGTQDEKMFRVVRDRERWFQVVMGEQYKTDELSTDKLADRVSLPEKAAAELGFRLEVYAGPASDDGRGQ